ncbi:Uncharacterised protein [Segatella copri]|nr:Uncharacterised protein [Segatella copri]
MAPAIFKTGAELYATTSLFREMVYSIFSRIGFNPSQHGLCRYQNTAGILSIEISLSSTKFHPDSSSSEDRSHL